MSMVVQVREPEREPERESVGDRLRLAPWERRMLALRNRRGTVQFVSIITAVSVVSSVAMSSFITWAVGASDVQFRLAVVTGFAVPLVIAPIVSYGACRMLGALNEVVCELDVLAHSDSLTGESNRRHFFSHAPVVMDACRRQHRRVLVGMVDVDDFKSVNDTLGHPIGDKILQLLATRLRESAGPDAVIGRLGGDEFALVVPAHDQPDCTVEQRVAAIEAACSVLLLSDTVGARASVGLVDATHLDLDAALRTADSMLYRRKTHDVAVTPAVVRDAERDGTSQRPSAAASSA